MTGFLFCASCNFRTDDVDHNAGIPYGWLHVTINVPPDLDPARRHRPFRWLGNYCSVECLLRDSGRMVSAEKQLWADLRHYGYVTPEPGPEQPDGSNT